MIFKKNMAKILKELKVDFIFFFTLPFFFVSVKFNLLWFAGLVSIIVSVFAMHCDWVPHCFTSRSTDLLDTTYHASDAPAETVKDGHTSIKGAHKIWSLKY